MSQQNLIKTVVEKHAKVLCDWLDGDMKYLINDKGAIKELKNAMIRVPHFNGPIYRGIVLHTNHIMEMLNGKKIRLRNRGLESWTADPKIAWIFSVEDIEYQDDQNHVHLMVSKKRLKKKTVVVNFANRIVQETVQKTMKGQFCQTELMTREKEFVTTPQCDNCELNDVEIIWLQSSNKKLVDALGFNDKSLKSIQLVIIGKKGSPRLSYLPVSTYLPSSLTWKRKPSKSGL